jgi:hypothetical protein
MVTKATESKKKTKKAKKTQDPEGFAEFWGTVPRKVGKGAARTAYVKALTKTTHANLMASMAAYARSVEGKDPQYVAHPRTWLHQERWDDEAPPDPAVEAEKTWQAAAERTAREAAKRREEDQAAWEQRRRASTQRSEPARVSLPEIPQNGAKEPRHETINHFPWDPSRNPPAGSKEAK